MGRTKAKALRDFLLFYTFLAVLFKSIVFIGLKLDTTHSHFIFSYALSYVFTGTVYRPALYCGFILSFASFAFLFRNRGKFWFLFSFNLIVSLLFIIDIWYLRGYNSMTSVHLLNQVANLGSLKDSILSLIAKKDAIFVIDIPFLLALFLLKRRCCTDMPGSFKAFTAVFTASVLLLVLMLPVRDAWNKYRNTYDVNEVVNIFDSGLTSSNLSPIGYHLYDIYSYWRDTSSLKLGEKEKEEIKAWFEYKKEDIPDNKYKSVFKGKNLIVIQVESLEEFVINQEIDGQEITPNLNRMLKNSLHFSRYYEQVNNGMSSDADLMTNTSVYPIRSGSVFFRYPETKYKSLPLLLRNMGYSTYAYHPDQGSFWNWLPALISIGFQKCVDTASYDLSEVIGFGISDGSLLKQVEPMIAAQKQPFYSFLVTLSSHMPFNLPPQERELKLDETLDRSYLGGYLQSVHYTDKHIGIFLENLKKDNLLDNTIIVVYGDHEGIHKFYPEDVENFSPSRQWWLKNDGLLPLIIYRNGFQEEKIDTVGGQIDLMPTLAYLLGIDEKETAYSAMGRNLLKTKKSFAVLYNGSVVSEGLDKKDEEHAVRGLNIADTIIRGNYFKN